MKFKSLLVAASAVLAVSFTQVAAAAAVTLNPSANNGGAGVIGPEGAFGTTGGTLTLGSVANQAVLTIASNVGGTSFSETGRIFLNTFSDPSLVTLLNPSGTIAGTGLGSSYALYIDFSFSGVGQWNPLQPSRFDAIGGGLFAGTLYAFTSSATTLTLGTLGLSPNVTNAANVRLDTLGTAPIGSSGAADTVFSAVLSFTPNGGSTGPFTGLGGFFQAPVPFDININVGSVGGNVGNTSYTVLADGSVVVKTPLAGTSPSTGNFTFTPLEVPEPGSLALVSLALIVAGASLRKQQKASGRVIAKG